MMIDVLWMMDDVRWVMFYFLFASQRNLLKIYQKLLLTG